MKNKELSRQSERVDYIRNLVDEDVSYSKILQWVEKALRGKVTDDMPLYIDGQRHRRNDGGCTECQITPELHSCGGLLHNAIVDLGPRYRYLCDRCGYGEDD